MTIKKYAPFLIRTLFDTPFYILLNPDANMELEFSKKQLE